jgi:hypothetical protein
MRKTKPRRKRKHTIGYYLMCGAPRTPIAHLEQLFAASATGGGFERMKALVLHSI